MNLMSLNLDYMLENDFLVDPTMYTFFNYVSMIDVDAIEMSSLLNVSFISSNVDRIIMVQYLMKINSNKVSGIFIRYETIES